MTEATLRSLINSYIVDNQGGSITPAKIRDMMQKTVDFIVDEISGVSGGGGGSQDIESVLGVGHTTQLYMVMVDALVGFTQSHTVSSDGAIAMDSTGHGIVGYRHNGGVPEIFLGNYGPGSSFINYLYGTSSAFDIFHDVFSTMPGMSGNILSSGYRGTISSGAPDVSGNLTVFHSMPFTPRTILIVPRSSLSATYYTGTITSTTFIMHFPGLPASVDFDWFAIP